MCLAGCCSVLCEVQFGVADLINLITVKLIALTVVVSLCTAEQLESAPHCSGSCASINKDTILSLKSFPLELTYILLTASALGSGS